MPRYFLHIRNGSNLLLDPDGEEFDDISDARREAIEAARHLMAECLRTGQPLGLNRAMVIADETGDVVAEIPFQDALP